MSNNELTPQQQLDEQVQLAYAAIHKAEKIANEHGLEFDFEVSYGMGGSYYSPKVVEERNYLTSEYYLDHETGGWVASSQTC